MPTDGNIINGPALTNFWPLSGDLQFDHARLQIDYPQNTDRTRVFDERRNDLRCDGRQSKRKGRKETETIRQTRNIISNLPAYPS